MRWYTSLALLVIVFVVGLFLGNYFPFQQSNVRTTVLKAENDFVDFSNVVSILSSSRAKPAHLSIKLYPDGKSYYEVSVKEFEAWKCGKFSGSWQVVNKYENYIGLVVEGKYIEGDLDSKHIIKYSKFTLRLYKGQEKVVGSNKIRQGEVTVIGNGQVILTGTWTERS